MKFLFCIAVLTLFACSSSSQDGSPEKPPQHRISTTPFGIYELYTFNEVKPLMDSLGIAFHMPESDQPIAWVAEIASVEEYRAIAAKIAQLQLPAALADVHLYWGKVTMQSDEPNYHYLYAVRIPKDQRKLVTGNDLVAAKKSASQRGMPPTIDLTLSPDGAKKFEHFTEANINKAVAIVVGEEVISAPVVIERISGGQIQISGNFTEPQIEELLQLLK